MYPICSDGSFRKNIPLVPNPLAVNDGQNKEPFKPEAETSHQISTDESPYAVSVVGNSGGVNSQTSHTESAYDRLELLKPSNDYDKKVRYCSPAILC